jgi:hypothetical protein
LALALPFSAVEKTSSLTLASTGCPKAAGAKTTSARARAAANNINFLNFFSF